MANDSPEALVARINRAYLMGLQSGPVRCVLTNRRLLILPLEPLTFFVRPSNYKHWRAATAAGLPYELAAGPYVPQGAAPAIEFEYSEIGSVLVSQEHGIFVDPTVTDLIVGNTRRGNRFSADWNDRPGIPARGEGDSPPSVLRLPCGATGLASFLRRTPLAPVLNGPSG